MSSQFFDFGAFSPPADQYSAPPPPAATASAKNDGKKASAAADKAADSKKSEKNSKDEQPSNPAGGATTRDSFVASPKGPATADAHAAEEDTTFIAESQALIRGSRPELQNPLFVPLRTIVDLMKATPDAKQTQLGEHENKLQQVSSTLKSYVHRHYDSFNDSIAYFSELIRKISEAQTCVATSHVDLSNVQGLFQCRAIELESHFRRAAMSILVKRILRNVAEAARGERQVDGLIQQRKFVSAARTFNRCREIISQPQIQRISSGIASLTFFAQRSSETIRVKTSDFLLDVVFLKYEAEDSQLMALALARSSTLAFAGFASKNAKAAAAAASSSMAGKNSGSKKLNNDAAYRSYYLASSTRDSPLFIAVRQAIGAFKQLGVLQNLPNIFRAAAVGCIESYFNALITSYAVFVRDDFSAAEKNKQGGADAAGGASSNFASLLATSALSKSADGISSAALIQMVEERRHLAFIQRPAVTAFFKSVLAQAATILCNLQRVVEIVLEAELPLFPNAVVASEVWKVAVLSSSSGNNSTSSRSRQNSWNVDVCRAPTWLIQNFVMPKVIRLVRDDASHINGEVLFAIEKLFGGSVQQSGNGNNNNNNNNNNNAPPLPMWMIILTSGRHDNFGAFMSALLFEIRDQLSKTKAQHRHHGKKKNNNKNDAEEDEEEEESDDDAEEDDGKNKNTGDGSGTSSNLSPGTIGAVIGLIREHTNQTTRQEILGQLQQFTDVWDMQLVWMYMQQLFVTMSRVLSGVAAAGEISDDQQQTAKSDSLLFPTSGNNTTGKPDNINNTNSIFGDDGRLGLERLATLLMKKDRTSYMPKYLQDDVGFLGIRVSNVADQLVTKLLNDDELIRKKDKRGDIANGTTSSGLDADDINNNMDRIGASDFTHNTEMNEQARFLARKRELEGGANPTDDDAATANEKIPNFAVAAAAQFGSSKNLANSSVRIPFPRVVTNLETALNHVIVPVAGNSMTIWICLEPFVGLSRSLLCLAKADIGGIFKDLGIVVSKQLLHQAHDYWLNQLSILDILSGYSGTVGTSLFMPDDKVLVHHSSGTAAVALASSNHFHHNLPPLAATKEGAASPTSTLAFASVPSAKPILEIVRCAARGILTDYSPLLVRALGGSGSKAQQQQQTAATSNNKSRNPLLPPSSSASATPATTDLTESIIEKCSIFVDTLLSSVYQYLSELATIRHKNPNYNDKNGNNNNNNDKQQEQTIKMMSSAKRALQLLTPTLNQGSEDEIYKTAKSAGNSIYPYLELGRTVEVPLAILAGAPDLWENILTDLRDFSAQNTNDTLTNGVIPSSLLHKSNLLSMMAVASISSISYSLKWFASEILEAKILSPILLAVNNNTANTTTKFPKVVDTVNRMIFKCRNLSNCASLMLGTNLLSLVLCKINDLRNDAAYKVETCNQRPSVFASELVSEIHSNFSVIYSHLDPRSTLWLVSLLAQPTANLLLKESVNLRDKRFSAAGVDQLIYDTLALESVIKSLLVISTSSSKNEEMKRSMSSGGSEVGAGNDATAAGASSSSSSVSPSSLVAMISPEETPAYLEMISKPFTKPLEFFRLLRRGNDMERARCVEDILARNMYPRFSLEELETLLDLVFREYQKKSNVAVSGQPEEDAFVTEQKNKLRNYVESTFNSKKNKQPSSSASQKQEQQAKTFKNLLSKASTLFGDVSGSGLLASNITTSEKGKEMPQTTTMATNEKDPPPQKQPTYGGDKKNDHPQTKPQNKEEDEEDEETEEEEEEEEEGAGDKNKKNPATTTNNNKPPLPATPASTIMSDFRSRLRQVAQDKMNNNADNSANKTSILNTPAGASSAGAPSPLPQIPSTTTTTANKIATLAPPVTTTTAATKAHHHPGKDNHADDSLADHDEDDEEYDEEEEAEEEEEEEDEPAAPAPPKGAPPPTAQKVVMTTATNNGKSAPPPPATTGGGMSLRDKLRMQAAKK